ncbi:MAG: ABC transporter permease [Rhodobiaceae bacterium]|nr:ABC transporter permease [Rhodobiaceae bacterium]MCC0012338.1 ABC transporter permease [Rhodobiaceae bacterium]MCC0019096.1 ABC transporter permease [Rhodobiaceae bacterium]MCC0051944.1 ABC transporter permease [Rhodobiaceae bacterium]
MSTTEQATAISLDETAGRDAERVINPIVPANGISGRALVVVIAIMAFLASLTIGLVTAISSAADSWAGDLGQELTIQVMPQEGRDVAADAQEAARIAQTVPGVVDARVLDDDALRALLEPWLGADFSIDELPVPRLVVIDVDPENPPSAETIQSALEGAVPAASIDDHKIWQERLHIMARTIVMAGIGIFALVLAATVLSIIFATRGAMAANRDIVQVLHLVGARERFIAWQFVRHFLYLGLKGGNAGGLLALLLFLTAGWFSGHLIATPAGAQIEALFGNFGLGPDGYLAIVVTVLLVAVLTAITAYLSVVHIVRTMV